MTDTSNIRATFRINMGKAWRAHCTSKFEGIMVGYSGGVDSTVLLNLAFQWGMQRKVPVVALHVIHRDKRLCDDADALLAFCKAECKKIGHLGVPIMTVEMPTIEEAGSPEDKGHRFRRAIWQSCSDDGWLPVVAHHADDQVEGFFIQTMRGGGRASDGMKPVGIPSRPLLSIPSNTVRQYAKEQGFVWHEDPTNVDISIDRNFWRHRLLPELQLRYPSYRATIKRVQRNQSMREELAEEVALMDGAQQLVDGKVITVADLSEVRKVNLVRQVARLTGVGVSTEAMREWIKNPKNDLSLANQVWLHAEGRDRWICLLQCNPEPSKRPKP